MFVDYGRIKSFHITSIINGLSDNRSQYLVLSNVFNHHHKHSQN
jgi:site-specific recombinase